MSKKISVLLVLVLISIIYVGATIANEKDKSLDTQNVTNVSEESEKEETKDKDKQKNKETNDKMNIEIKEKLKKEKLKKEFKVKLPKEKLKANAFNAKVLNNVAESTQIVDIVFWTEDGKMYSFGQEELASPQHEIVDNILSHFFNEGQITELEVQGHPAIYHQYDEGVEGNRNMYLITEKYGFLISSPHLTMEEMISIAESIDLDAE